MFPQQQMSLPEGNYKGKNINANTGRFWTAGPGTPSADYCPLCRLPKSVYCTPTP